jgi:hypothetical protein
LKPGAGLLGDALEGRAEVDAGADHDGELGGEVQDVLLAGLAGVELAEALEEPPPALAEGRREREDVHALVAQERGAAPRCRRRAPV